VTRARAGLVAALIAAAALLPGGVHATTVLRVDLPTLTADADRIFVGRVVTVRSGRDHRRLPVTWITFAVDEALKGAPEARLTIKQIGVAAPLADGTLYRIPALPTYREGDEVLLFLHPDSAAGFTSPVGFGQGRFRIRRDGEHPTAENDTGNRDVKTPAGPAGATPGTPSAGGPRAVVPSATAASGPMPLAELLARVRVLVREAR
jgi:hypothetical protein